MRCLRLCLLYSLKVSLKIYFISAIKEFHSLTKKLKFKKFICTVLIMNNDLFKSLETNQIYNYNINISTKNSNTEYSKNYA